MGLYLEKSEGYTICIILKETKWSSYVEIKSKITYNIDSYT